MIELSADEIAAARAAEPLFAATSLPGGLYQGVDNAVNVLGVPNVLVASAEMSDDLAYAITNKLWMSVDDPILVARSNHNKSRLFRFGNQRNYWVKVVGVTVLILVFLFPIFRMILKRIKNTV